MHTNCEHMMFQLAKYLLNLSALKHSILPNSTNYAITCIFSIWDWL